MAKFMYSGAVVRDLTTRLCATAEYDTLLFTNICATRRYCMVMIQERTAVVYWDEVASPIGPCFVLATENGVCWTGTPGTPLEEGLVRTKKWLTFERVVQASQVEPLQLAVQELQRYFAGEKITFSCLLDLQGTPFQIAVWQALGDIP